MRSLLFLLCLVSGCVSYKFLIYNPIFGHSHTTFMGRIADTLFEAGHDVTVFSPLMDETLVNKTGLNSGAKLIRMEQDEKTKELMGFVRKGMFTDVWTMKHNPLKMISVFQNFTASFTHTCNALSINKQIIELLRAEKFDVGIAEPLTLCGFGLFDHIGIPSTIGAASIVQLDVISWFLGEPTAPSYVPTMLSTAGERMTFFGRLKNSFQSAFGIVFKLRMFNADAEILAKNFGKDYSNIGEIIASTSFMFTNGNPYLNYPRPLLHKTVEIGGISIDFDNVGELGKNLDNILNERNHTVFISFGSVSKSKDMPEEWKKSILEFCGSMPNVTFIWKYENPTTMADHLPNVYLMPWLPQNALLSDPRLSLFITHGGLGSTTEVAHFGKPAIMIPVFGDQLRNAEMLARHGGAIVLQKTDLANPELLKTTVDSILNNAKVAESASRLAKILRGQPISPKELVVSHAEFVAKFGPLKQLDPYGRQLNILQYYLVDVIAFIVVCILVLCYAIFHGARFCFRKLSGATKLKSD